MLLPLALIVGAIPQATVPGQTITDRLTESQVARIDAIFADAAARAGPGYSVGVVRDGQLAFARGYGLANLDHGVPLTPTSVLNIASLSKQFTGAAVALLVVDRELSLDDSLGELLADVPDAHAGVTVAHLVYMTSGIPEYYEQERPGGRTWTRDYFEVDDAIAASLAQPPDFVPGTEWSYSNVNYMLLTRIVERVSGESFASFARRRIFEPLGMANTHVNDDVTRVVRGRATGYNPREGGGYHHHVRSSPHFGGSGVFSTVEDLARWDRNLSTHALAGPAFTELLLGRRRFDHDKTNDAFGLVWGDFGGRRMLWYEGGDTGFSSYMARLLDEQLTVIVLSNLGTGRSRDRAHEVLAALLGD